jgi:hypothetical protein
MTAEVVGYIAREAVRRYGPLEPRLAEKLQRNLRRNFRVTVPREEIRRLAEHYKAAYAFASATLPRYLRPRAGRYADPADVRIAGFAAALKKRYPRESRAVRDTLVWYTVYYEYLR